MSSLLQNQCERLAGARYPLHMPGHKRRVPPAPGLSCYAFDLTEIDGADDLHDARGILAEAMARTAALYGSARCRYLVGGSTVGLLAGIRALAPFGSEVLVARNCHKAVYHALELGHLTARYLIPPVLPGFGVYGSVAPAAVAAALDAHPAVRCVILTSPTYEGVQSDLRSIARICHARGVPLLVDEAHGAHYLPLAEACGWQGGRGGGRGGPGGAERPQNAAQPDPDRLAAPQRPPGGPCRRGAGTGRVRDQLPQLPAAGQPRRLHGVAGGTRPPPPSRPGGRAWTAFMPRPAAGGTSRCWGSAPTGPPASATTTANCCCASVRRGRPPCAPQALSRRWSAAPTCWP